MDLAKLLHGFVKVVLCISCPLPNKTKLKFDQDFKVCWSFCFELKVLGKAKYSMPWVSCAFGNVENIALIFIGCYTIINTEDVKPFFVLVFSPLSMGRQASKVLKCLYSENWKHTSMYMYILYMVSHFHCHERQGPSTRGSPWTIGTPGARRTP